MQALGSLHSVVSYARTLGQSVHLVFRSEEAAACTFRLLLVTIASRCVRHLAIIRLAHRQISMAASTVLQEQMPGVASCSCSRGVRQAHRRAVPAQAFLRQSASAIAAPPVLPFQKTAEHLQKWTPDSWRPREAKQQPNYPDAAAVDEAVQELRAMPPLVFAGECRNLQARLAACAKGEAFWLQGTVHMLHRPLTSL